MTTIRQILIRLLLCLTAAGVGAQEQQAEVPVGIARLHEFEATYQAGQLKIQTPLLNDYAVKLQQLLEVTPPADQPAVQTELDRVKKLLATGGIIDLRSAGSMQAWITARKGGDKTPPGAVLALKPGTARGPAVLGSAVTIGRAEWDIVHLEAGSYEVSIFCSYPAFTGTASIKAVLAGAELTQDLKPTDMRQFRVLRLGKFRFDEEVRDQVLAVELNSADLAGVQLSQVFISKPRTAK